MNRLTLTEHEAAKALGLSVHFLRKDRRGARVEPFVRIGTRVVYRPESIASALERLEVGGVENSRKRSSRTLASAKQSELS